MTFIVKDPENVQPCNVNWGSRLPFGTSIDSVEITISDLNGNDLTEEMLVPDSGLVTDHKTLCKIRGGVSGLRVEVKHKITLSDSSVLIARVPVIVQRV